MTFGHGLKTSICSDIYMAACKSIVNENTMQKLLFKNFCFE